nr:hypothetical protein [uncultured Desulfuromonas sp.]
MKALQFLVGLTIDKSESFKDYLQLVFSNNTILKIYNNYKYSGGSVVNLRQKKILFIVEETSEIVIDFGEGGKLFISLLDVDYNGPEALELIREDKSPVVWQ